MARTKSKKITRKSSSKKSTDIIKVKNDDILLSEKEVWDVLQFASSLYGNVYTPQLVNQQLQAVSMSPQMATADKIDAALLNPKEHEEQLVGYSEFFELTSMVYKRVLYYLSGMLSFDLTYVPIGDDVDFEDAKFLKQYKKDVKIVNNFLDKFDIKKEFGTAIRQMLRQEAFFSVLRDEGDRYTLQELNHQYCLITGRWDYGLLFDFDILYFIQPGVDINMFPRIFKSLYNRVYGENESYKKYNPSNPVDRRTGSWVLWTQTSPKDGFWCFKFNPELATRIPFLAPMFSDVVLQPVIRKLQTNAYIASASKLVLGKIPMLNKDVKGGVVKDSVAVSPDLLGKFLALLKSGLSEAIKVGAAPLEDMKAIDFPLGTPFYEEFLKTTTASSGVNSRLIFTLDKNNAVESQLSINVDEYLMEHIYPYFSDFLEYQINKKTKTKFKFFLEGTNFFTNREERLNMQKDMMSYGIVNMQKIAAALGQLPHHFERQLAMTKINNFVDGLTPIIMGAQMPADSGGDSSTTKTKGRPTKPTSKLTDSGSQTREDGGNAGK